MESHTSGDYFNEGSLLNRAIGTCPEADVMMDGVGIRCLLDTGAQVSTVTETFYREHLSGKELVDIQQFLTISAANGLAIPYLGYIETNIEVLGRTFDNVGFLVVRDPSDGPMVERKKRVPGVIGSNIFRIIASMISNDKHLDNDWQDILALYEEATVNRKTSKVRVSGRQSVVIPARSISIIEGSVARPSGNMTYQALVEEIDTTKHPIPNGLSIAPAFINVTNSGKIPLQVANFSSQDVILKPRTVLGNITPAERYHKENGDPTRNSQPRDVTDQITNAMEVGQLNKSQIKQLRELVESHQDIFSMSDDDIGFCDLVEHRIPTNDDNPVRVPHRRIPPHQWDEVRNYLQTSLKSGIIRDSSSPYASPVVLVRKKNGKLRLCVDYRALNAKTRKDAYPLPRIEEALDALKGAKYFCWLDLAHGFHQLPVAEADIEKTALRVGTGGLYEFTRMPFGLTGAPGTFMRVMDKIFGDQNFQTVLIYLDDILVFGRTFEETMQRLDMVLKRLAKHNLKVKPDKCQMFKSKLRYLGHQISEEGLLPDPDKTAAVLAWTKPNTETELRGFLGLAGYYRRFIRNFASIAAPLHNLLHGSGKSKKKKQKSSPPGMSAWDSTCDTAFQELKEKLTSSPVLGHPDFSRPFILEIDASMSGLGAVLSQDQENGRVVLCYASRALRNHEKNMKNYSSMKLELLTLKWAVTEKLRDLLIGAEFTVLTDNNPLSYINSTAKLGATEMRWVSELAQFNFNIKYRSGKSNTNADSLSRKSDHLPETARLEEACIDSARSVHTLIPHDLKSTVDDQRDHVWETESQSFPKRCPPIVSTALQHHKPHDIRRLQTMDKDIGRYKELCLLDKPLSRRRKLK